MTKPSWKYNHKRKKQMICRGKIIIYTKINRFQPCMRQAFFFCIFFVRDFSKISFSFEIIVIFFFCSILFSKKNNKNFPRACTHVYARVHRLKNTENFRRACTQVCTPVHTLRNIQNFSARVHTFTLVYTH
jgi:predicted membrane protein